jgi:3-phenylpropionate/trans-cinnamate dioxygenase alpha subunit
MDDDPVLVVRDTAGTVGAFLNVCRHRGDRLCRAEDGNAASFICAYYGWTFGNDGRLIAVPNRREAYHGELDLGDWSLIPVAHGRVTKVCGSPPSTPAPPLREYLGDGLVYRHLRRPARRRHGDRREPQAGHALQLEVSAENFCGDAYHVQ